MKSLDALFEALSQSAFRRRFRLSEKDVAYIERRGLATVLQHGRDLAMTRIVPARPRNDGRQTPWRGHPIFPAQHATATCCRGCLEKWHRIPRGRELTGEQLDYVVAVWRRWLESQLSRRTTSNEQTTLAPSESDRVGAEIQKRLFD